MAYTKVNWVAGVTPLSEANMDHLETQYDEVMTEIKVDVSETEVYNANAPTAWTDLDLSGTIGSRASLVLIKIYFDDAGVLASMAFRKNGDTDEIANGNGVGVSGIGDNRQKFCVIAVPTDSSGIVEWKAANARTTILDVINFINKP